MREHLLAALREAELVVSERVASEEEIRDRTLQVSDLTIRLREAEAEINELTIKLRDKE